ncbi:hypothetical protein N7495_009504 [Penicillium taxi]|uniref:uncharacterized protein n=1 Tax=Penicillium taxi TaxID=168475 RepID=UPI002545ABEC|nr:uncharacterized protein N7495_009504 [Penicillium taxi]KAJ5884994.1 hypothetical protein N7495_009504 [Penicillium taxi]
MSSWTQNWRDTPDKTPKLTGRVHVLGVGNVGTFVAHALASRQNPPPITLLFHHSGFYEEFRKKKKSLSITYNGLENTQKGFDVEFLSNGVWQSDRVDEDTQTDGPIECLILCSKATKATKAIQQVSHRLNSDSSVVLMQNGMGIIETLNERVFPDPNNRPHYIHCVNSHALTRLQNFSINYNAVGTMSLSPEVNSKTHLVDADIDTHWAPSTKYLLRLLTLTPSLVATTETPAGMLQIRLEKLAINCIINPLTAINDCKNGELLYNFSCTRVMRLLLFEISSVICALPELQGVPGIQDRFSPERLRRLVTGLATTTAANTSSMLSDVRSGKQTEVHFINGWIVDRGEELGIKCALNYMLMHLVKSKLAVNTRNIAGEVPIDNSKDVEGVDDDSKMQVKFSKEWV